MTSGISKASFDIAVKSVFLLLFICLLPGQLLAQDSSADLLNRAYELLNTRPDEAAKLLTQVIATDVDGYRLSRLDVDAVTARSTPTPRCLYGQWEPVLRVLPMPADANHNGDIFGGWIM